MVSTTPMKVVDNECIVGDNVVANVQGAIMCGDTSNG